MTCSLTPLSVFVGEEEARGHKEKIPPLHSSAAQEGMGHLQAPIPAADGSVFSYGKQYSDPVINPADQPLEFASRFNDYQDLRTQSLYAHHETTGPLRGIDASVPMTSGSMWTPSMTPDVAYPSIPAVLPSGSQVVSFDVFFQSPSWIPHRNKYAIDEWLALESCNSLNLSHLQHDPSVPFPPPVSGHAMPSFPRFSGPSFQPATSPPGGPFGLGAGLQLPPPGGFSADSYGLPGSAERPKKVGCFWYKLV